jgi:hypothetical protein
MLGSILELARERVRSRGAAVRLRVEGLEDRWCPATPISFTAQVLPGHQVQLSGNLAGEAVAGVVVTFTGAVNATTTTDSTGAFSYTTSDASLGIVYASASEFDDAAAEIAVERPDISALSLKYSDEESITVTGSLTDIDAAGRTITFSGAANGAVTTDNLGRFSFTTAMTQFGMLQADMTDLWNQAADTEAVYVSSGLPVILDFACHVEDGNLWVFTGRVNDEYPEGLTIRFGGLLQGHTTTVQADGTFSFTIILEPGTSGTVTAITTDWWGQDSEMEYCFVG